MNLSFNILWIEDDYDFFNSTKDLIDTFLRDSCIEPIIEHKQTLSVKEAKEIGNKYDVIFVDYSLPNDYFGTELIRQVRSNSLLPDIVFYSSLNSIEAVMEKEESEGRKDFVSLLKSGIYFSSSNKMANTAIGVIKKIIARDEKINGFKGLVLSSISRFESNTDDLLVMLTSKMNINQKQQLYKYISKNIVEKDLEHINKYYFKSGLTINDSLPHAISSDNRHLDHNKRIRVLKEALKILNICDFDTEEYFKLTKIRNSLGHLPTNNIMFETPIMIDIGEERIKFDHQLVVDTRKCINYWRGIFDDLIEKVK